MLKTDNPLFTSILDSMSDGQWHSMSKVIKNNSTHLSHLSEEDRSITLVDFFTDLAQEGHILLGNNDSQRFTLDSLIEWREFRGIPQENNISSPRFFGGVLEDDGWDSSPLRLYDVIHFRATGEVTQELIQELIGVKGHVTKDVDGLYRIMTIYGNDIYLDLKQWSIDNGYDVFGARLDKGTYRREINELPTQYFNDLCEFYGKFAHTLLRKNLSSIKRHIPDEDDRQQQIYLWIIDAVQRYNNDTCIPFAAYLSKSLNSWVHDLGRKIYGRSVSDIELKLSRLTQAFEKQHSREPTYREIAEIWGEPEEAVRKKLQSVNTVNNIRNVATLDSEDFDIPVIATHDPSQRIHDDIQQTMISSALTKAVIDEKAHPAIWLDMYQTTWGGKKQSSIALSMGLDDIEHRKEKVKVQDHMRNLLIREAI